MTATLTLTRDQAVALAPLRCAAREASDLEKPGLVLGQIYFMKDGSVRLIAGFIGHETGKRLVETLHPQPEV